MNDRYDRRRLLSLAGATVAAALAGCGGPGEGSEDEPEDPPQSGVTTDPNTSESTDEGHGHQPAEEDSEPGLAQEDQENATPTEEGTPDVRNVTQDDEEEPGGNGSEGGETGSDGAGGGENGAGSAGGDGNGGGGTGAGETDDGASGG